MIHIAICDDEEVFVEKIRSEARSVLETQDEDFEIFCYTDGNKLLADYEAKKFDLVLLDIDMPDVDGFEVARILKNIEHLIEVIFITSHNHLVYSSFMYKPLAFIPKDRTNIYLKEYLSIFFKNRKLNNRKFIYKDENMNTIELEIKDIAAFFVVNHDLCFLGKDNFLHGIYTKRKTLSDIFNEYGELGFIKVNRSTLVNFHYIKDISSGIITLLSGKEIKYNRNNHNLILSEYRRLKR